MSEKKDLERARVVDAMCVTWRHDFGLDRKDDELGSCGMTDTERDALRRQMGQLYDHHISPMMHARSLPVGVPDGYMPIPTAEQLAEALENVRSFHDMSAELIAPRLLANLLASTTVKAEQADEAKRIDKQCRDDVAAALGFVSGGNFAWSYLLTQIKECVRVAEAPSLPAAGSSVEEVEVVAWRSRLIDPPQDNPSWQLDYREDPKPWLENEPLMTVAQHERITAALAAEAAAWRSIAVMLEQANAGVAQLNSKLRAEVQRQRTQSAPELVSVPVELAERIATHLEWDGEESLTVVQYANKCDALAGELRALLASHAEGGKV